MEIAVAGRGASLICNITGLDARPFRELHEAARGCWDVLALTPSPALRPFSGSLCVHSLLLPGDSNPSVVRNIHALQLVGYGFSPRDTLTFSSFTGKERLLCLQRSLLTAGGELLEPQELPLPSLFACLSEELALPAAGLFLLSSGRLPPE